LRPHLPDSPSRPNIGNMTSLSSQALGTKNLDPLPARVIADLRTDQAGETGAVCMYQALLKVAHDPDVRAFEEFSHDDHCY
jgi:demethoxyubiquinone hydroxylase (CLK1/Coq7/Cat5 family)